MSVPEQVASKAKDGLLIPLDNPAVLTRLSTHNLSHDVAIFHRQRFFFNESQCSGLYSGAARKFP